MAAQSPHRRASAEAPRSKTVKASVILDVNTHVKLSAAAAMLGIDKSTYMSRAITEALKGIVVIDRRRPDDLASQGVSAKADAPVEGN